MIRARLRRHHREPAEGQGATEDEVLELDPRELHGLFATPGWLRDLGVSAWLLVGVTLLLVGLVWLLALTSTIVLPVITAAVVAAVASPLVGWVANRGIPRPIAAILFLILIVAVGIAFLVLIVAGVVGQSSEISSHLSGAENKIQGWVQDLGADQSTAQSAKEDASNSVSSSVSTLLNGVVGAVDALSGIAFFLALTALSLIFLLADGPKIRAWVEAHSGVPVPVAHTVSERVLKSLRGYFLGVTIVAAFNAIVVTIGALIFGVPLIGTIVVVTFAGAYIPYLGAWAAGAFTVLIALGGAGTDAAIGMAVVQLLANGILQQLIQPIAYGAALGIHPLAVLIVTIGGGALFGAVGLILGAPLTAAVTKISADLARARAEEERPPPEPDAGGGPVPEPAG
jgi:predicted PurR-regulated permease PerM